jgi:hypothetical protein
MHSPVTAMIVVTEVTMVRVITVVIVVTEVTVARVES